MPDKRTPHSQDHSVTESTLSHLMQLLSSGARDLPNQITAAAEAGDLFGPSAGAVRKVLYEIVNGKTGEVVGKASTRTGARRAVDRHDNKYGGYIHRMRALGDAQPPPAHVDYERLKPRDPWSETVDPALGPQDRLNDAPANPTIFRRTEPDVHLRARQLAMDDVRKDGLRDGETMRQQYEAGIMDYLTKLLNAFK